MISFGRTRSIFLAAVCAAISFEPGIVAAQQSINLTIASSHPTTFMPVGLMSGYFRTEVDKALADGGNKYRIVWKEAYGGTLYKLQDTMEAVRDGITDIGFVGSVWEADTMPLSNVTYFAPFVTGDVNLVLRTLDTMIRQNPDIRKEWESNNLQYLGAIGIETYQLWSKSPVLKFDDLKGKRYNAPSTSLQWLRNTGAAGVDGGLPTYYTNVQAGVVDGAITMYSGILPFRLHEVATHITEADIGAQFAGGLAISLDRFRKLPPEVQAALVKVGQGYTSEVISETLKRIESSRKAMADAGAKIVKLPEAERVKWAHSLPDIAGEWAKEQESKGLPARAVLRAFMDEARKAGAKPLRDWDK